MAEPPDAPAPPVLLAVPAPLVPVVAAVDVEALLGAPGCPRPLCPRP